MLTLALCVALTLGAFCFAAESEDASNEVVMTAEEAFVAEQMEEVEAEETTEIETVEEALVEETTEITETEESVEEVVEETTEIVEEINDEVNEIVEEVVESTTEEAIVEETEVDVTEEVEDEMVSEIETAAISDEAEEVAVEETVESTMHGAARAPYFEVDGEAAYCVDPEATHPENGTTYSGEAVTDYSFLNKVFINRELLRGQDDEMLNRATQLAVWQTVNPTGNYEMAAKAFLNERGFEFYKQLLADIETEGWNVDYTLYTTSEVDAAGNAIQRLISAFANKAMVIPEFNSAPIVEVPVEEPEVPVEEPEVPVEEPKEEAPEAPIVEETPEVEIPEISTEEPKEEAPTEEPKVEIKKAEPVKEEKVVVANDGVRMLSKRLPKTGDNSDVHTYIALAGLSLVAIIYATKKYNK